MLTLTVEPGRSRYLATVYLNGAQLFSNQAQYTNFLSNNYITIGAIKNPKKGLWRRSLTGKVDELVIWKRILNFGEISRLYKESKPREIVLVQLK